MENVIRNGQIDVGSRAAPVLAASFLAGFFLLVAPFLSFGLAQHPFNDQRIAQVVLILLTQLSLTYWVFTKRYIPVLPKSAWLCLIGFIALGVLSALVQAHRSIEAFGEVGLAVGLGSLAALSAQVVVRFENEALRWIGRAALCLAGAYILAVAVRILASIHLGRDIDIYVFVSSGYTNPRFPSTTLALLSVLVLLMTGTTLRSWIVPLLAGSMLWAIQLGLGTRAAWAATGGALLALALVVGIRRAARLQVFTVAVMGFGTLLYFGLITAGGLWNSDLGMLGRMQDLTSSNLRDVLWARCVEYILSSPLLGIGPMQFAADEINRFAHPHNWFLQLSAEWGIPAVALLLAAGYFVWRAREETKTSGIPQEREDVLLLGVLVALFYGLLDGNYVMPISQTAIALTVGAYLGISATGRQSQVMPLKSGLPLVVVVIVSAGALAALTGLTVSCQHESVEQTIRTRGFAGLAPRYWVAGWVPFCGQ